MNIENAQKISVFALVLLITGAIDSVRNLPTTALFGSSLVFFFIFSAIIFLIPVALVSAELSAAFKDEEGGVYTWVKEAMGENWAFMTIWLQWINTMVWFQTILSFIAGTIAYLINPALAQNKLYLICIILSIFWGLTFIGLRGLKTSATFASICALAGMIFPMAVIIVLAGIWIFQGNPLAIELTWHSLLPDLSRTDSWISLTAIMTSYLGMELAAVHVRDVRDPQKNFPKAMFFSVLLIIATMTAGSLAIAIILPRENINLVDGVMEAFHNFFQTWHLDWLMPVVAFLLLLGSLGSMVNWIISPAKGLLQAARHGFLPQWLYVKNKQGIASRILIMQALLVTLLCSGFLLLPDVNAIYWLFTSLSTELYVLMYVLMFLAAFRLKGKYPNKERPFCIPGGKAGYYITCLIGLSGCILTLIAGLIPPEEAINIGSPGHYRLIYVCGLILMILPAGILLVRRRKTVISTSSRE